MAELTTELVETELAATERWPFADASAVAQSAFAARERLVVVWRLTERCNLSCGFCRYDRREPFARRVADEAAVLAGGRALADWERRSGRPVLVSWLGGEPYLWKPLLEVSRVFRHQLGLEVGVTTNGVVLGSPAVRRHALDDLAELTVSVDGLGDLHDRLRGWRGGFAHLRRAVSRLADEGARRGHGPLLRANVVLMRDNVEQLPALCRELADWGIVEVTFNQLGGNDRPAFHREHHLLPAQVAWLAAELPGWQRELAASGLRLLGSAAYLERLLASAEGRPMPVADCRPGERFLFVGEDGIASPCSFTTAELGVPLATALGPSSSAFRGERRPTACGDCHSTQVCGKYAPGVAAAAGHWMAIEVQR